MAQPPSVAAGHPLHYPVGWGATAFGAPPGATSGVCPPRGGADRSQTRARLARGPPRQGGSEAHAPSLRKIWLRTFRPSRSGAYSEWSCPPSGGGRAPRRPPPIASVRAAKRGIGARGERRVTCSALQARATLRHALVRRFRPRATATTAGRARASRPVHKLQGEHLGRANCRHAAVIGELLDHRAEPVDVGVQD